MIKGVQSNAAPKGGVHIIYTVVLVCSISIAAVWSLANADATVNGRQYTPPNYVFNPDLPHDLVTHDLGAIGFQPFVDNMAWEAFIALNWPVADVITERGVPDRLKIIGGAPAKQTEGGKVPAKPAGPVVWETYKDSEDIFLPKGATPTGFDAVETIPAACQALALKHPGAAQRTLTQQAKVSDVLASDKQAFTDARLVDQNGQNVWYDVKVNRTYFDYVFINQFYQAAKQKGAKISFPASSNTTREEGTVKVKAAWKVMGGLGSQQPDDQKLFYTTDALIYDKSNNTCIKQTVGLVGLHVVMKTATLPQWMWGTFEHVKNAPTMGKTAAGQYNFYNVNCQSSKAQCKPNQKPSSDTDTTPTQVVRIVPISEVAASANTVFQAALRTLRDDNVWANYELIDAQWGASPSPLGVPNQPKFLANTTMETYLQEPKESSGSPHGCINCHGGFAKTTDLDFQLFKAQ